MTNLSEATARSVGAHVRDAAAYVCWSLARAYDPANAAPAFTLLAPALLATACYDREVRAHMRRPHVLYFLVPLPALSVLTVGSVSCSVLNSLWCPCDGCLELMPKSWWCVRTLHVGDAATGCGRSYHRMVCAACRDSAKCTWSPGM